MGGERRKIVFWKWQENSGTTLKDRKKPKKEKDGVSDGGGLNGNGP